MDKFVFSGSPEQLQVLLPFAEMMWQMLQNVEGGGGTSRPLPVYVRGYCYIKLYFIGTISNTNKTHRVEKSFRLMKDDPRTISLDRLKYLASRIWEKFDNFIFATGHDTWTYNDPEVGFNRVWGHFHAQDDAQRLFEQLLDIINESPDWQKLSHTTVPFPGDRFAELPDKVQQAGVLIRPDQERPVASMRFHRAAIKFPHLRSETDLVTSNGGLLNSLDFVSKYEQPSLF